jgi:GTPase SAR1 family protein
MELKPVATIEYHSPQAKWEFAPPIPVRAVVAGPSGCGKTSLTVQMLTQLFVNKGSVFEKVYVFSPSIFVDPAWLPIFVKDDEQLYYDHWDSAAFQRIIDVQHKVIQKAKQTGQKKMFNICIVVDDFADSPQVSRNDTLLHSCFTRGRHNFISTIVATQKYRALSPIIRVNASALIVFRCRSQQELDAIVEENSGVLGKDVLTTMYRLATSDPYSFLYINTTAKDTRKMFWLRFERPFTTETSPRTT